MSERSSRGGYLVGVRREPDGLGSKYLHDKVKVGKRMRAVLSETEPPDFTAERSLIVAEDIGIFYAWSLLRAFELRGRDWRLRYDAWSQTDAAFLRELNDFGERVRIHVRSESRGAPPDWDAIAGEIDAETTVYATVSAASRDALADALARRGLDVAKRVRWTGTFEPPSRGPVEFEVTLARSNVTLPVHEDESILAAVRDAGIDAPFFCGAGICGTCRTRVLAGEPRHLDAVLSPADRASNQVMMICRSRAASPSLVLDL